MKKTILIACVLLVAVVSTACINNFAVQDLNNKAMQYMEQGDYMQAIERLKSSLDLDSSVFETHYNLAVAYTAIEDYTNAIDEFNKALNIKPDSADVYYSLATAENNLVVDIEQGKVLADENNELYKPTSDNKDNSGNKVVLSENEKKLVSDYKSLSVENYKKYLELMPAAKNRDEVESIIMKLSDELSGVAKQE